MVKLNFHQLWDAAVGGKLKFDGYPRSLKKLVTCIAGFAFFVAIVVSAVLYGSKPVSSNEAVGNIPADLGQFKQVNLHPEVSANLGPHYALPVW